MSYHHQQQQQHYQQPQQPDIHSVPRVAFPVLSEPFLVDSNYEFVKELGQGELQVSLSNKEERGSFGRGGVDLRTWEEVRARCDLTDPSIDYKQVRTE